MRSRIIAGVSIVGLLVGGLAYDSRQTRPDANVTIGETPGSVATSAAWFCPATAANGSIIINNSGVETSATASFVALDGSRESTSFQVGANSQAIVDPAQLDAPLVATTINSSSVDLSVSHRFDSDGAPLRECHRRADTKLTFVDGQTLGTNSMNLVIYNPFPDDAVVNVTFDTELGPTDPDTFDGVVVGPRSIVTLDVAAEIRRREWITSHITVRRGRVVAEALQGPDTKTQTLLSPVAAQSAWTFSPAQVVKGAENRLSIYNPGDEETGVTVNVTGSPAEVIPFTLRVPGHGRTFIDLNAEARVPKDVPVGISVESEAEVIARRF